MSAPRTPQILEMTSNDAVSTFRSIFFPNGQCVELRVPDYQRAYAWEAKQVALFLSDLKQHKESGTRYYFGHFIVESINNRWELVDGQQRVTTFLLFLAVCRFRSKHLELMPTDASSLIERFSTVSYDARALVQMLSKLAEFFAACKNCTAERALSEEQIQTAFGLRGALARSQRRLAQALLCIHQAFEQGELRDDAIVDYVELVMEAHGSCHLTADKSVAVNIFELHNSRGVRLTTLDVLKAKLMKFVYDHDGEDREQHVSEIQTNFGAIFALEEALASHGFRGEMTAERLLRLHLRVIDDGCKQRAEELDSPALNENESGVIAYVETMLRMQDAKNKVTKASEDGVRYALKLSDELHRSMRIVTEELPKWDRGDPLVGDVMVLDRDLSCQWFLIICRKLATGRMKTDGRVTTDVLRQWEKLLFTRDFHDRHHNARGPRDNFSALFSSCVRDGARIGGVLHGYLGQGFLPEKTPNLQESVREYIAQNRHNVLTNAFYWWRHKITYAIYKYETHAGAQLRQVMKGTVSVEHILPQEWQWDWVEKHEQMTVEEKEVWIQRISAYIHGLGNLLLLSPAENTGVGNRHPSDKIYICAGGSYSEHNENRERWKSCSAWAGLIAERGDRILDYMLIHLVGAASQKPGEPIEAHHEVQPSPE